MAIVISGVNNNDKITASDGTIDLLSGVNLTGILTAPSFSATGNISAASINVGSNIQLGNAGVATATTFVGNLTGNVNNTGNNYEFENDTTAGISSVVFTGISSVNGDFIKSDFDINQNQLPRGGLIVSLGSTPGLGYAPLIGAEVKPKINAEGSLTSLVGIGTSIGSLAKVPANSRIGIQTAVYDHIAGIITVTTTGVHGFSLETPSMVQLKDLEFSCPTKTVGSPSAATYTPANGNLVLTINNHGLVDGDAIKIKKESLKLSCNHGGATGAAAQKDYPRATDPAYDKYLTVSNATTNTFQVNVLLGTTPTNTSPHVFVQSNVADAIQTLNYLGVTTSIFSDHERPLHLVGIISVCHLIQYLCELNWTQL